TLGNANELAVVFDRATAKEGTPDRLRVLLLGSLEQAVRRRNLKPAGDLGRVAPLLKADSEPVRAAAARLAGAGKPDGLRADLLPLARSPEASPEGRAAAFDGLVSLGGPASKEAVTALVDDDKAAAAVRRQALTALTALDLPAATARVEAVLALSPDGLG